MIRNMVLGLVALRGVPGILDDHTKREASNEYDGIRASNWVNGGAGIERDANLDEPRMALLFKIDVLPQLFNLISYINNDIECTDRAMLSDGRHPALAYNACCIPFVSV